MSVVIKLISYVWASPNSLIGLLVGVLGLLTGGKMQIIQGVAEFHGGAVRWLLRRTLLGSSTMAMTLGHTILGQTETTLAIARKHEHVHVRQYGIWGPFFIPAYLFCSLYLWCVKRDPYRDNPFEIEAYNVDSPSGYVEADDPQQPRHGDKPQ